MKVLLLEDIKGLGKKGEVCEVKDGYGQNFLIAKNKAKHATNEVINKYRSQQKHQAELEALELEKRKQLAKSLESITLVLEKKGNNGTLFGSITKEEIATALQEKHNLHIDKKEVDIPMPIKHTGAFAVIIHLGFGINANLAIEVKEL